MTHLEPGAADVNFLLANFADETPGVADAIVVSSDGLLLAMSSGLNREEADRFAAAASGLISLAHGAAAPFDGGAVHEIVIELEAGFIFVTGISDGSTMAVMASDDCDVGLVGYQMGRLADRCGAVLTPAMRSALQESLARR